MSNRTVPAIDEIVIDSKGVVKLRYNLKTSKSVGPNSIPNLVLKSCAKELSVGLLVPYFFFFLSCISLFRIAFTHHNHDTYWNSIFNNAQQKFFTNIGQGHNLCKPKTFIT